VEQIGSATSQQQQKLSPNPKSNPTPKQTRGTLKTATPTQRKKNKILITAIQGVLQNYGLAGHAVNWRGVEKSTREEGNLGTDFRISLTLTRQTVRWLQDTE
jgi:hypothetical protein